jgi:hypothetical protein
VSFIFVSSFRLRSSFLLLVTRLLQKKLKLSS